MNRPSQQPLALGPLMLDLEGPVLSDAERDLIADPLVGGIIFFARNFQFRPQLDDLVAAIRAVRPEILLAVDQEGGRVQRFQAGFTRLPAMQRFAGPYGADAAKALALCRDTGWLMAAELLASGLDFSFAPVLDVDADQCSVIADRAFAPEPGTVIALAGAFIEGMHDAGMAATGKHFPGHGGVSADSHHELPVDTRPWEEIAARDWRPFAALADRLDGVMPAHIVFTQIDEQAVGYSKRWLQQKLRGELGFDGVIFSDDLSMAGAAGAGDYGRRAELALAAGCDMVPVCNNRVGALAVLDYLRRAGAQPNARVGRMRARRRWDWDALEQSERRQAVRQALETAFA